MENRFGVKDFFLFVLLIGLIVAVVLAMKQYDRQWAVLQSITDNLTAQSRDMAQLRRAIQEGVRLNPGTQPTANAGGSMEDPFKYVKAAQAKPDYAVGDWYVDNFGVKLSKITPLLNTDLYATIFQARVVESLAYLDPYTADYIPLLATGWQVKDDSEQWEKAYAALRQKIEADPAAAAQERDLPKELKAAIERLQKKEIDRISRDLLVTHPALPTALEVTFQLRRGVTFSDGAPFTADDVVFTYNWIMNPAVAAPRDRAYMAKVTAVEKKGDYEVVFKLREPYYEYMSITAGLQIMAKHFYGKYPPEQFNESTGLLLGTGPYKMKDATSWRPGDQLELVRNERYWGEPGPFDKILYYEVEQDSAAMTMFKNKEVDVFAAQPEQYREMLQDQNLLKWTQHYEYTSPPLGYAFIAWNQKRNNKPTPFTDKRVRQAMTMLTDRQRLVDEIMLGYGSVASGPFSPLLKQADPNIKPWPFDPNRAKALLKAAGYEDRNRDGVIEGPDGVPFRFKFTYGSSNRLSERIALFLKDSYAKAGIALELDPADWSIMLRKMDDRDYDAITLAWGGSIESDLYQIFHSSQIADKGDNFTSYINPELDRMIERARSTVDEQKRMPLWQATHRILHEDQPYTFLISRQALVFMDKRIQNVERSKIGLNFSQRFVMPIPWYVPKAMQKWSK